MTDRANAIAEDLQGTCQTLTEVCERHGCTEDDLTQAEHAAIDNITEECSECNWWCEPCEMQDDGRCKDCADESDDDDDTN